MNPRVRACSRSSFAIPNGSEVKSATARYLQVLIPLAASGVDENEETEETINSAIGPIKLKRRVETCFEIRTSFLLEEVAKTESAFPAVSNVANLGPLQLTRLMHGKHTQSNWRKARDLWEDAVAKAQRQQMIKAVDDFPVLLS